MTDGTMAVTDMTPVDAGTRDDAKHSLFQSAEQLSEEFVRTAERAGMASEAGALWAAAGELSEFGLGDADGAEYCYNAAIKHPSAPVVGFSGLRRLARQAGEMALVGDLYRLESEVATGSEQAVRSAVQRALWLLHQGADRGYGPVSKVLAGLDSGDPWALLLAYQVREDLALLSGDAVNAAELKVSRFELARTLLDLEDPAQRRELAELAASLAGVHLHLTGRRAEGASWLERALDLVPSETVLRELAALRLNAGQLGDYEARLRQHAISADSPAAKARAWYELGMLRAHMLKDSSGARDAFREGMRCGDAGTPAAHPYLTAVRGQSEPVEPNALVDALGLQAELAATPRERADCLYQMSLVFDGQLHLPDAAIELLRDALTMWPGHRPAARTLGRLYQRSGSWSLLAELLEEEVRRYPDSRRTRLKLAETYQDRLGSPERAEPHLRTLLERGLYAPAQRRLNRLLDEQRRWPELHDHLVVCAQREKDVREQVYEWERAAEVAERRLDRLDLAVMDWQAVHEIDPLNPRALASLGRLYSQLCRWEDLVRLNEDEIAVRDEVVVAARLWTKNGEIYEHQLSDEDRAQQCYELALEIEPLFEPALEALGRILWRNRDWDGLAEMYRAEIDACEDEPRRIRRMLDLGEIEATLAGRSRAALTIFNEVLSLEPESEEALLWVERLYQTQNDHSNLLLTLERRLGVTPPEGRAALYLRAGSLAEWALDEPLRAWTHYLGALYADATRSLAVIGLGRLWPRIVKRDDLVRAGREALESWLKAESDPSIRSLMVQLLSRLSRGKPGLTDWSKGLAHDVSDVLARSGSDLRGAVEGDIESLAGLRLASRTAGLWALMAQMDLPEKEPTLPCWLPRSTVAGDVLAELDRAREAHSLIEPVNGREDGSEDDSDTSLTLSATSSFRDAVRAWMKGKGLAESPPEEVSIATLRLRTHRALSAGNSEEASYYAELEARNWTDLANRQDRLTTAAEMRHLLEPGSARTLFEEALSCESFGAPSRRKLYDVLDRCGELELLIQGLTEHAASLPKASDCVEWLERLAAVYERSGDREEAIAAWTQVIEIEPNRAIAILELVRLMTLESKLDDARAELERSLRRSFPSGERLMLLARLADLHLMEGGDGSRSVAALEEAAELAEREPEWLRRLARAHYRFGSSERAVALLTEALPSAVLHDDLGDWFLLARLKYLKLNDLAGARELLWGLLEQYPNNIEALRELEAFYRRQGGAAELAERISTLLVDPPDHLTDDARAFVWEYAGDLNYQVLRRNRDAEIAYEAAIVASSPCSRLALKRARAIGQQPGKSRQACAAFATALRQPGVGLMEWLEAVDDLEALFEGIEDPARVRVMRQIRDLLQGKVEPDSDEARIKRDPARQVDPKVAVERLADGLVGQGSIEVMRCIAPIIERCFGSRRARKRALGGRRLRANEAPDFLAFVDLASDTLQSSSPKLFMGAGSEQLEWLSNGGLWLPESIIVGCEDLGLRFWAGHVAAFMTIDLGALSLAEPGEIEMMLSEVRRLEAGGAPSKDDPVLKEVAASRHSQARATVMEVLGEHDDLAERAELERWFRVPSLLADRFGLLIAGDVRAAADALMVLEDEYRPGQRADRILTEPRCRDLLEYALSHSYQELRYLAGLAGKPKPV